MKFQIDADVMPLEEILDPQGKAVVLGLENLGFATIEDVRIGRHVRLTLEANDEQEAKRLAEEACRKLLANLIMERYTYSIKALQ